MTKDGKHFRQYVEKLNRDDLLRYRKAVYDEGLCLAIDIASEILYRDNVISRQEKIISTLREEANNLEENFWGGV